MLGLLAYFGWLSFLVDYIGFTIIYPVGWQGGHINPCYANYLSCNIEEAHRRKTCAERLKQFHLMC